MTTAMLICRPHRPLCRLGRRGRWPLWEPLASERLQVKGHATKMLFLWQQPLLLKWTRYCDISAYLPYLGTQPNDYSISVILVY